MKIFFSAIVIAMLSLNLTFSQKKINIFTHTVTGKPDVVFEINNPFFCDFYIDIQLKNLINLSLDSSFTPLKIVPPGNHTLLKLVAVKSKLITNYGYKYAMYKGRPLSAKPSIAALKLPFNENKNVEVVCPELSLEDLVNQKETDYHEINFKMAAGDSIFACKEGVVSEIKTNEGYSYIEIFHSDGTFARYENINKLKTWVKEGSKILTGQALAAVGNNQTSPTLSFTLYYVDQKKLDLENNYSYLIPLFTKKGQSIASTLNNGERFGQAKESLGR
ncbi:MAG: M23 family metallopeptidase [Pseudarcicella sp.]|nr:M23 family metallopeptidase [Pseudarcicella sp.]MBP6410240.1 M23 family metallopeptidase [Pseudarcicella sp.]